MISKETFKALVEKVTKATGKTQETLALDMGYGKNYISEILSPSGKITKKFVDSFKMRYEALLENPKPGVGLENATRETGGELITTLMSQLITLTNTTNKILERQEKDIVQKIERIDTNLSQVSAQAESLKFDLVSGRMVVLQSLARIEGAGENHLLKQADNIRADLARGKDLLYRSGAKGSQNTDKPK